MAQFDFSDMMPKKIHTYRVPAANDITTLRTYSGPADIIYTLIRSFMIERDILIELHSSLIPAYEETQELPLVKSLSPKGILPLADFDYFHYIFKTYLPDEYNSLFAQKLFQQLTPHLEDIPIRFHRDQELFGCLRQGDTECLLPWPKGPHEFITMIRDEPLGYINMAFIFFYLLDQRQLLISNDRKPGTRMKKFLQIYTNIDISLAIYAKFSNLTEAYSQLESAGIFSDQITFEMVRQTAYPE